MQTKENIEPTRIVVAFDKRAHSPYLVASCFAYTPTPMPWFGDKQLVLQFAGAPALSATTGKAGGLKDVNRSKRLVELAPPEGGDYSPNMVN